MKPVANSIRGGRRLIVEGNEFGLLWADASKVAKYNPDSYSFRYGMTAAHDVIEHCNGLGSIGTYQDELQAFGTMTWVRVGLSQITDSAVLMDIWRMAEDYAYQVGTDMPAAPRIYNSNNDCAIDDFVCDRVRSTLAENYRRLVQDAANNGRDTAKFMARLRHFMGNARPWMLIGARKAMRRFMLREQAYENFVAIENAIDNFFGKGGAAGDRTGERYVLSWGGGDAIFTELLTEEN